MERLTEQKRNNDGTGVSKQSLIDRSGKGYPNSYCSQILTKLADYEDLEEQGKLLKLPCAYGEIVYVIPTKENALLKITKMKCLGFSIGEPNNTANLFPINRHDAAVKMYQPDLANFGKTFFLNKEEAETVLKIILNIEQGDKK